MSARLYKAELTKCFNFAFGTNFDTSHEFSNEELFSLNPDHIYAFLALKVFGTSTPIETDKPTKGRSSSIEYSKKAISYLMPNRFMKWDLRSNSGNPTKSIKVNDLIKRVKKHEVRKEGKASSARRAMELSEFQELVKRCRKMPQNHVGRYTGAAYFLFQFHMIAIIDDVEHFRCEDITANIEYSHTLKSKMRWSKNVLEERESPDQIIMGSMDPRFCVLLGLTLHLEHSTLRQSENCSPFLFSVTKSRIRLLFDEVTTTDDFPLSQENRPIGTHSICKLPATYARQNGCSKDDVEARGRWKSNKRIADTHIDCLIPYPDAKVASSLCINGPAKYMVREDLNIDEDLILSFVGSNISSYFPRQVALVLGRVLLWAVYDEETSELICQQVVDRVKSSVQATNRLIESGVNPVKKFPWL